VQHQATQIGRDVTTQTPNTRCSIKLCKIETSSNTGDTVTTSRQSKAKRQEALPQAEEMSVALT